MIEEVCCGGLVWVLVGSGLWWVLWSMVFHKNINVAIKTRQHYDSDSCNCQVGFFLGLSDALFRSGQHEN